MAVKSLGQLEEHAFFVVMVAIVLIAVWFSVWGLLDEAVNWLEREWTMSRRTIFVGIFAASMIFVALFPSAFERIF